MTYWYDKKPEYKKLIFEVKKLFLKNGLKIPSPIIGSNTPPDQSPEEIFLIRVNSISMQKSNHLKALMELTEKQIKEEEQWNLIYKKTKEELERCNK